MGLKVINTQDKQRNHMGAGIYGFESHPDLESSALWWNVNTWKTTAIWLCCDYWHNELGYSITVTDQQINAPITRNCGKLTHDKQAKLTFTAFSRCLFGFFHLYYSSLYFLFSLPHKETLLSLSNLLYNTVKENKKTSSSNYIRLVRCIRRSWVPG